MLSMTVSIHFGFNLFLIITWKTVIATILKPHVVIIVADDMGWNDVSFHGSNQIFTPNIDALAYNGVILKEHYVQPSCTPTRGSLMTGKYPIRTGTQGAPIYCSEPRGLPLKEKILPEYFRELGYSTNIVGKWHLGYYKKDYTPLERGFDSHLGQWNGALSYYSHDIEDIGFSPTSGHDLRRNYSSAWDLVGKYLTDVYTEEAVSLISNHPTGKPLLLVLAHAAPHAGNRGELLQAPFEEVNKFKHINTPNRRTYAAMVSKLDQSVGEIVNAMKEKGILDNSIIVFLSDNGSPCIGDFMNWGSNYPFRGQKMGVWEGSVRTAAFIWSSLIQNNAQVYPGLIHVSDWLPTLLSAAGTRSGSKLNPRFHTLFCTGADYLENLKIDGINQWPAISKSYPSLRKDLLIEIDDVDKLSAFRFGNWKYIKGGSTSAATDGFLNMDIITSPDTPPYDIDQILNSSVWRAIGKKQNFSNLKNRILKLRNAATVKCQHKEKIAECRTKPCLFNLEFDPCEQLDLSQLNKEWVLFLEQKLQRLQLETVKKQPLVFDILANPIRFNNSWSIWR